MFLTSPFIDQAISLEPPDLGETPILRQLHGGCRSCVLALFWTHHDESNLNGTK